MFENFSNVGKINLHCEFNPLKPVSCLVLSGQVHYCNHNNLNEYLFDL